MLCNVFMAVSTILPVCLCSPPSTLKGRDNLLSLGTPPRFLCLFFFCQGEKAAVKKREEKPNNQMSLDKQLINVFSLASTQESLPRALILPPHLEKDKNLKNAISKPRSHLQTNVIFQFYLIYESFKNTLLFYFSLLCFHSQGGRLTGKRVCCYKGGGTAGGGSCYHLMLFFAFQKACKSRRGEKGHTVK